METQISNNNHKDIPGNPSTSKSSNLGLRESADESSLRVLSLDDWNFWLNNGYVVVKNAISRSQAKKTADFLWEFEEKDAKDPDTWYAPPRAEMEMKELAGTGMVVVIINLYHSCSG